MTSVFQNTIACMLMIGMWLMFFMALLTPERTANGNYTKPFEYWTNQQYYCDNFNPTYCKKGK